MRRSTSARLGGPRGSSRRAATRLRERAEQRETAAVQRAEQDLAAAIARESSAHAREVKALTKALELAEARISALTVTAADN